MCSLHKYWWDDETFDIQTDNISSEAAFPDESVSGRMQYCHVIKFCNSFL